MIIDRIDNTLMYNGLTPRLATALTYLRDTDFSEMELDRYNIDGDEVYAMVQGYTTKDVSKGLWEAHRRYIDVQFVADGIERMGYANLSDLTVSQEYDDKDDYLLLQGEGDFLTMPAGTFIILGPQDAHMPQIAVGKPCEVIKVVVKVAV